MNVIRTGVTLIGILLVGYMAFAQQNSTRPVVAGFYPYAKSDVLKPENIPFKKLTHLIYCFAIPQPDGSIITKPESFHNIELIKKAHAAGCKVIVMLGGGGENSDGYHVLASKPLVRKKFISTILDWCRVYGYDGVNIDWEYPGNNDKVEDRNNLTSLVKELRTAFDKEEAKIKKIFEISIDVHSMLYHAQFIDFDSLKKYMDWFGLMSYDYAGDWPSSEHAAHNAPLYCGPAFICDRYLCVDGAVHNYIDSLHIPAAQLVLGVPFYGRQFENKSLYETPKRGGEGIAYYDVALRIGEGWTRHWDDQSKVPYLIKDFGTGFISYDDAESIRIKIDYVKQHKLKGVMIWEITHDVDPHNNDQPLLDVIHDNIAEKR